MFLGPVGGSTPASNSGDPTLKSRPDTGCPDQEFYSFLQAIQVYAWVIPQITPRQSPSAFFPIYNSFMIHSTSAI
jgi:hypothetical protein